MLDYLEKLAEEFEGISREFLLEIVVDIGRNMSKFPDNLKTNQNKVTGCVSNVFIALEIKDNKVIYYGTSDSLIVQGYVKILIDALNGISPKEVIESEPKVLWFIEKTQIANSLIPSRVNSFGNIYAMMKTQAEKYL